jgi:hypothetical protein
MQDPTRDDMLEFLRQHIVPHYAGEDIEFDIEEAIYWFASDYHGGQWSNLYSALCQSPYKPGALQSWCGSDIAVELVEDLVSHFESNPAR